MRTEELITEAKSLPKELRREFLSNHCSNLTTGQYFRRFDEFDQSQQEKELANRSIELSRLEEQFDAVKSEWKAKIKVLKEELGNSLTLLKQNGEWVDGDQFMFADQKRGVMEFYDANGDFITSRRLLPEEKQLSIFDGKDYSVEFSGKVTKSDKIGD